MTSWESSDRFGGESPRDPKRASATRKPKVRVDVSTFFQSLPRELLQRILDDDPLDLDLRCELRRDETCLMVSRDRLLLKAAARCAYAGCMYRGDPPIDEWIAGCIDQSIRDILEEDESGERRELPIVDKAHYEMLSEAVGFTPELSRAAHVAFNNLRPEPRKAYFALSVQGFSVEEYAANSGGTPDAVRQNLAEAVGTLLRFLPSTPAQGLN